MSGDEAAEFLAEFDIQASATDRVLQQSYEIQGLMSFFTVGEDEVRAWTVITSYSIHYTKLYDINLKLLHNQNERGRGPVNWNWFTEH